MQDTIQPARREPAPTGRGHPANPRTDQTAAPRPSPVGDHPHRRFLFEPRPSGRPTSISCAASLRWTSRSVSSTGSARPSLIAATACKSSLEVRLARLGVTALSGVTSHQGQGAELHHLPALRPESTSASKARNSDSRSARLRPHTPSPSVILRSRLTGRARPRTAHRHHSPHPRRPPRVRGWVRDRTQAAAGNARLCSTAPRHCQLGIDHLHRQSRQISLYVLKRPTMRLTISTPSRSLGPPVRASDSNQRIEYLRSRHHRPGPTANPAHTPHLRRIDDPKSPRYPLSHRLHRPPTASSRARCSISHALTNQSSLHRHLKHRRPRHPEMPSHLAYERRCPPGLCQYMNPPLDPTCAETDLPSCAR